MTGEPPDLVSRMPDDQERLRRQNVYLAALHETTLSLINRLETHDLLEAIVTRAGHLLATSHGYVYLVVDDGATADHPEAQMEVRVGLGVFQDFLGLRIMRGQGMGGRVWQTGQPVAVAAYDAWAGRLEGVADGVFQGLLGVPLRSGKDVIGVLGLAYVEQGRAFGPAEIEVLDQFGQLASLALENARLYTAAQQELAERGSVEAALRQERQQLRQIVADAPVAMAMFDTRLRYLAHSERWLSDNNLGGRQVIGRSHDEVAPDVPPRWREACEQALGGQSVAHPEDVWRRGDGTILYLRWAVNPWRDSNGAVGGIVVAWVQVNELIEAREAAVEALRLKSEFLASMSHEIRTPLTGVLGMTDLLLETELTSEQREYATTARQSGQTLLMVLNTILDFSRIEAGHITLESGPFSPRALVDEAVTALSGSAPRKGLTIGVFVAPETPETLHGDAARIRQVLLNLLDNAIKFTEVGGVELSVVVKSKDEGHVTLLVSVSDTGIGLPPGSRATLFEPFTQADSSSTRRYGGTGLGLSIGKRLIEMMGGAIGARDREGAGSVFWFTLRLASPSSAPEEASHVERQKEARAAETVLDPRVLTSLRALEAEGEQGIVAELIGLYLAESPRQLDPLGISFLTLASVAPETQK